VDQELVAYFDWRFAELKTELKSELTSSLTSSITSAVTSQLRAEIAASAAETRRHFDVVADRLMDKIQLVGDDVIASIRRSTAFAARWPTSSARSTAVCSGSKRG
jgi:hypothetical protein